MSVINVRQKPDLTKVVVSEIKIDGTVKEDFTNRLVVPTGAVTEFTIELMDKEGNRLETNDSFALPVAGLLGQVGFSKLLDFTNGVATVSITWDKSGEWQVTAEQLNVHFDKPMFEFDKLSVSVVS